MSFILDALKKSEAERQRQAGPTLLELRITHPRRRYPLWSLIVGGLLAANVAVLLIFVLNRTPPAAIPSAPGGTGIASSSAPVAATPPAPRLAVPPASASVPVPAASPTTAVTKVPPLVAAPDVSAPPRNPADYEPALPPGSGPQVSAPASQASAVDYSNLPSISQIGGNVPAMQLNLLISSDVASERYALINMQRVHEGDVLADGARVLAITPNGVAMDYRGQDFLLHPGGTAQ